MSRLACLIIPNFPLAALVRTDPNLVGVPLALTEGSGAHARVVATSARGVRRGHTATQACAIAANLVLRPRDPAAERSAALALADVATSLASRVELAADGTVFLDAEGARHLVPSEAGLGTALAARAARVGLVARVGIGASMTVARLAALHATDIHVVPAGHEGEFLAPLLVRTLAPDPDTAATLERWGIRQLGDLARLPSAEVSIRLGAAGPILVARARGEDARPLAPTPRRPAVEESLSLEYPIAFIEALCFVLRGMTERALERIGLAGVGCTRLHLALDLDDRSRDVRTFPIAAPTRDVRTLLTILRVALEAQPPRAAVTRLTLSIEPARVRPVQLGLFSPPGPAPERLVTTLARLAALCGDDRVGAPVVLNTHRPGMAASAPFAPDDVTPQGGTSCRLVVRAVRPPEPVHVFTDRERPDFVRGARCGGRVVSAAGPWRLLAEWWTESAIARDYYDLELSDGGLYRCYREHDTQRWFIDGIYD